MNSAERESAKPYRVLDQRPDFFPINRSLGIAENLDKKVFSAVTENSMGYISSFGFKTCLKYRFTIIQDKMCKWKNLMCHNFLFSVSIFGV